MRNNNEINKKIFEDRGGLRVGRSYWISNNFTHPLAKIYISREKLVFTFAFLKIQLKKREITFIKKYRGFFSNGIKINHKKLKAPKFIVFWSFSVDKLIKELKKRKYKTK